MERKGNNSAQHQRYSRDVVDREQNGGRLLLEVFL